MTQQAYAATVGEWVRAQREELGVKQEELAAELRVSDSTISGYESGRTTMSGYTEWRIRSFFERRRKEQKAKP